MSKSKILSSKKFLKPKAFYLLVLLLVLVFSVYFFTADTNPVKSELTEIQEIAQKYKNQNGHFGTILPNERKNNCFEGSTFVKVPEMNQVLSGPDVENISCVFKTATNSNIVEAWSITIVKGERAFCEDSSQDKRETPGLTTTHRCDGNL